jgi:hypothetical protein
MDGEGPCRKSIWLGLIVMLWQHYVFRRGMGVSNLWDRFFRDRPLNLLYIGGRGFDPRAQTTLATFVRSIVSSGAKVEAAELLLVGFKRYELDDDLKVATEENAIFLRDEFSILGQTSELDMDARTEGEDELSTSNALRKCVEAIVARIPDRTDIVLDVSSLPRIAYLAIMTGLLYRLVPDKIAPNALAAGGVNLQVLVAEDSRLDSAIRSEDPNADLVTIPGFSTAMYAESMQDWPMVWFPILGENRVGQLNMVMNAAAAISGDAEICPIIPHPSRGLRRAERLLIEYKPLLFDKLQIPVSNALYVSESNPFETYRQLLGAMERYRKSLAILGGCRLAVTPLSSKLVTLGAGLACFEMRLGKLDDCGVAMPYAEPMRYVASKSDLAHAKPEIACLVLTGAAYA